MELSKGVIRMTSTSANAFGSEFLPGRDVRERDDALRAMERRYGGIAAAPFNDSNASWTEGFYGSSARSDGDDSSRS